MTNAPPPQQEPTITQLMHAMDQQKTALNFVEVQDDAGRLRYFAAIAVGPAAPELKAILLILQHRLQTDEDYQKRITDWAEQRIIIPRVVPPSTLVQ